ncbi:FusB/FusC family EF-G-binding protein [Halobacillus sp. A5]|uniref:FusB/FusC family EF-G-binding protein n=1 Tax=Halobacillus sp. A5 TaxID=2880263 RepID=UPI0020A6AF81|nr:FusB/FusC family EF-G-binding protein [Halobacillus sp. A5]MCP3028907.1 FusB/FusC family EF-G-binding protein [Halobacillus sp. A5]
MNSFIRSDQFNFIKNQTVHLINGHSTVNDTGVIQALKSISEEKVFNKFEGLTGPQADLVKKVTIIEDQADAVLVLSQLKHYVIPFPEIPEEKLKKLFPQEKKFKVPLLRNVDRRELSYLGWNDPAAHRKFIVFLEGSGLKGITGDFIKSLSKGICSICNEYEKVGMFTTTIKESEHHTVKRGNYICQDSMTCNQKITSLQPLHEFLERLEVQGEN